jgi:hypothetical protein
MTYTPEEGAQIFKRDAMGGVRLPRARREELLNEYELSQDCTTTRATVRGKTDTVEAVIEQGPEPKAPQGSLRIYFSGGAYCQITNTRDAGLAAELLGCLGSKR